MVKCFAPHAASHGGKPIVIADDGSSELTEAALAEMRPHGFREWTKRDEANRSAPIGSRRSASRPNPKAIRKSSVSHGIH